MFRAVELEINSMCNRKCVYCPNVVVARPHGYMADGLFRKIVDELARIDFDGVVSYHFYGEPLLDRRLLEFVEYTARHVPRCKPTIFSNGDLLTVENFRQYVNAGLYLFWITQHDNRIPPNLQYLVAALTAKERQHLRIDFGRDLRLMNRGGLLATGEPLVSPLRMACDWPLNTFVITMHGKALLCCNDYYETEVMGDVAADSLRAVWCSEQFERFRRALARGDRTLSKLCERCDYAPSSYQLRRVVVY